MTSGITAAARVLAVLADATAAVRDVAAEVAAAFEAGGHCGWLGVLRLPPPSVSPGLALSLEPKWMRNIALFDFDLNGCLRRAALRHAAKPLPLLLPLPSPLLLLP